MKKRHIAALLFLAVAFIIPLSDSNACTRVMYQAGPDHFLTARSMDWGEDMPCNLWLYPRGMKRDGGVGPNSIKWVAKYGSVTLSAYDFATSDGMNEKGLVANLLYLAEADYGSLNGKPGLSIGAWPQYVLDNFATVQEAVDALREQPFRMVAAPIPGGFAPGVHYSVSDPSGDSAIFEYVNGRLIIHHGKKFKVMTNSPVYDQQLALDAYWKEIGGLTMLPGTNRAADRFVRASYYTGAVPENKDPRRAVGAAFSIIRNVSVPLGLADPTHPNIASTLWRSVSDQKELVYYYESTVSPNIFWVDMHNIDFGKLNQVKNIVLEKHPIFAGDVSGKFKPAKPFKWLAPKQ